MQRLNSDFNKLKLQSGWFNSCKDVDNSRNVKKWLNHSNIIIKYLVACVLVYYNKCKMQFLSNDFNILKVNGSILIIEKMWKKSLIYFNINVGFLIITCVLINYGNGKMQLISNGFNLMKIDGWTHVPCW